MNILAFGAMLNAALYLAGCFAAGVIYGNSGAWHLATESAGFAYVAYCLMLLEIAPEETGRAFRRSRYIGPRIAATVLSIMLGIAAGVATLF